MRLLTPWTARMTHLPYMMIMYVIMYMILMIMCMMYTMMFMRKWTLTMGIPQALRARMDPGLMG